MPIVPKTGTSSLHVDLIEDDGGWSCLRDAETVIERAAHAVARRMGKRSPTGVVSIALSSDAHVAALNEQYRGKAKPTNVLSFPSGSNAPSGQLGDIILARETVAREAAEQGIPLAHHVQHLVVHGILHLLGYDHMTDADAEQMEAIEISILSNLGIANPYTGTPETGRSD